MATLFILAGANGSGKTSFYITAKASGFIADGLPFLNVDMIARDELGGYTPENLEKATLLYRERAGNHIGDIKDFMIESNLAKQSDFDWLEKMKAKGYELVLLYLGTSNITINIKRVEKRVKEGGHFVPENIIRDRYDMGLLYLRSKLSLFKETYLLDNSNETKLIAIIKEGHIDYKEKVVPAWVSRLLFLQTRMAAKKDDQH
jgi:predicted ABC-type ATPase